MSEDTMTLDPKRGMRALSRGLTPLTSVALVGVVGALACLDVSQPKGPHEAERARLIEQHAKWAATRPQRYSYSLQRSCFCVVDHTRAVTVTVDRDSVTSRVYVDDGTPV